MLNVIWEYIMTMATVYRKILLRQRNGIAWQPTRDMRMHESCSSNWKIPKIKEVSAVTAGQ